ncbi:MAG TPA: cation-translocating P-type ATPase [Methylomirabilota bacterium]|nr:cation-translocating P-type ATPase [Methylomirabilota bacterium]
MGMTCQGCARSVGEAARSVPGVAGARVDLAQNTLFITWAPTAIKDSAKVVQALDQAGYTASLLNSGTDSPKQSEWSPTAGWKFNLVFGGIATVLLIVAEWVFGLGMTRWYHWAAFAIATPVQLLCGSRFYIGAWNQLKRRDSNMDTLVALGSTTAYVYSVYLLFRGSHGHVYFMDSVAIITLISVGHFLEARMSMRAATTLRALLELMPATARRVAANGALVETPIEQLTVGDKLRLLPGDKIPLDGAVLSGRSAVNESMLTGESRPVEKQAGSKVYGGSINEDGQLDIEVNAVGSQTALARIIAIVQQAQDSKANIQRLGDAVSSVFVPIVICLALGTALWWGLAPESARALSAALEPFLWNAHQTVGGLESAIFHACAVLIIACPCAMGLATPIAIMAGANAAAEKGILVRDAAALEKSGTITCVVFDKTGTLTKGRVSVAAFDSFGNTKAAGLASALASKSNHPLSKAIASHAAPQGNVEDWKEIRGSGIEARVDGRLARLGSFRWIEGLGGNVSGGKSFHDSWAARGATVNALVVNDELIGLVALQDQLKDKSAEVVKRLERDGLKVHMVTGDSRMVAQAIAGSLGIPLENVHAEQMPEGKVGILQQLQERGEKVCFIGDGINDAPALEQANLGIAVSAASDVAREAADIILINSEIEAVPEAIRMARATLRAIKQNLFWAFFYNAAGVPLAILGFFTPMLSAAAMGLSDLIVIMNALRLRYRK